MAGTSTTSEETFDDAIGSIEEGVLRSGRPVEYVLALLEVFTAGGAGNPMTEKQAANLAAQRGRMGRPSPRGGRAPGHTATSARYGLRKPAK